MMKKKSTIPCTSTLAVVFTVFVTCQVVSSSCPPAEVGKPYMLSCRSSVQKSLYWDMSLPSGKSTQIAHCDNKKGSACAGNIPINVLVSYQHKDPGFISQLLIQSVKTEQENQIFTCFTSDGVKTQEVTKCKLRVYHKPEVPECTATLAGDNRIRIQCSTQRVFPDLACHLTQHEIRSGRYVRIDSGFHYHTAKVRNGSDVFYGASCYVELQDVQTGLYQFTGKLSPAWRHDEFNSELSVAASPTPQVTVETSPAKVVMQHNDQWPVRLCPPGSTTLVAVTCNAYGFESRPTFEWYVGEERVNAGRFSSKRTSRHTGDGQIYESTFKFRALPQHHGSIIMCKANNKRSLVQRFDSARFSALWPPSEMPQFRDATRRVLKGSVELTEGAVAQMHCTVKGGEPEVISVSVNCYKEEERFAFSATKGSITTFTLNATKEVNHTICKCSAGHKTGCYYSTAILSVLVKSRKQTCMDNPNSKDGNSTPKCSPPSIRVDWSFSYYVIAGVAALIIAGLIMFCLVVYCGLKSSESEHYAVALPQNRNSSSSGHLYETIVSRSDLREVSLQAGEPGHENDVMSPMIPNGYTAHSVVRTDGNRSTMDSQHYCNTATYIVCKGGSGSNKTHSTGDYLIPTSECSSDSDLDDPVSSHDFKSKKDFMYLDDNYSLSSVLDLAVNFGAPSSFGSVSCTSDAISQERKGSFSFPCICSGNCNKYLEDETCRKKQDACKPNSVKCGAENDERECNMTRPEIMDKRRGKNSMKSSEEGRTREEEDDSDRRNRNPKDELVEQNDTKTAPQSETYSSGVDEDFRGNRSNPVKHGEDCSGESGFDNEERTSTERRIKERKRTLSLLRDLGSQSQTDKSRRHTVGTNKEHKHLKQSLDLHPSAIRF